MDKKYLYPNSAETEKPRCSRDVLFLCCNTFLSNLYFDRALWIIYLVESGISIVQIGIIESLLHFSILLFEIPTGIIADLYGKRTSMICANLLASVYACGMLYADRFSLFSLVFLVQGLSETLISGTDSSILFDLLKTEGKEKTYVKILGRYRMLGAAGLAIGIFCGGLLKLISWKAIYGSLIVMQLIAIIPLIFVKEYSPTLYSDRTLENSFTKYFKKLILDTVSVFKKREFALFISGFILFTASINTLYIFGPLWLKKNGFADTSIAFIYTIDSFISMGVYASVHRIVKHISLRHLLLISPICVFFCLIATSWVGSALYAALFILVNNLTILLYPLSHEIINTQISAMQRSTVFSTLSFMGSVIIIILFPLIGKLSDFVNINSVISGLSCFSAVAVFLLALYNRNSRVPKEVKI